MRTTLVSLLSFFLCYYFIYLSIYFSVTTGKCLKDQESLLLQLKNNLTFKSEKSSSLLKSWNQSIDCCNWSGVTCDHEGHVIGLDLSGEFITGGFDDSSVVFSLKHLQKLNLADNNFNSVIPSGFHKLDKLTYLNLSYAGFIGQIPTQISQLTRLVTLDITTIFYFTAQERKIEITNLQKLVQNLTSIRQLYLDGVSISVPGHEWCSALLSLHDLQELSMSRCNLSGPLCPSMERLKISLRNQSRLAFLDLSDNQIQGIVPNWIWKLQNLQRLNISHNLLTHLEGPLQNLTSNLIVLDFHHNKFQGSIPAFPENAIYLDYSSNKFSSWTPGDISNNLPFTVFLSLSNNSLHGNIPDSLCNASYLEVLDLSMNKISGTIPSCLLAMTETLKVLNMRNNNITGPIPDVFSASCVLRTLDLHHNKLVGKIPNSLANSHRCLSLLVKENIHTPCLSVAKK